jgi:SH3 domain protein
MKKSFTGFWILAIFILSVPTYSQAKTGYVSDMLILTFRQGPGNSFQVLQTLKSDTPLMILGEKSGYYKVELTSGETGWVDKQFVVFEIPKTQLIDRLNQEKAALITRIGSLTDDLEQLKTQLSNQESDQGDKADAMAANLKAALDKNSALSSQLKESQTDYTTLQAQSQNVLEIAEKNKMLEEKNIQLANALAQLEKQTTHLFRTGMIKWFLAGVGVLLLGWIIGQSVSSKKRRNNSLLG